MSPELFRCDPQGAQVVAGHKVVPETRREFAIDPGAVREIWTEKIASHDAIVSAPVRMRALKRTCSRQSVHPRIQVKLSVELVTERAKYCLLVCSIYGPQNYLI